VNLVTLSIRGNAPIVSDKPAVIARLKPHDHIGALSNLAGMEE
jgi:hypothetical protein